jgi:hypothetical protein
VVFIEHPQVTERLRKLNAEDSFRVLQVHLMHHPEAGEMIQHSGGFRKVRMDLPGRGKSGSARVIYIYFRTSAKIFVAYVYVKGKSDTLSQDQLKSLRAYSAELRKWL